MEAERIRALLAKWRTRSESFDKAIEDVDKLEAAGVGLPDSEGSKLISQAHQNELERCLMELEDLLP